MAFTEKPPILRGSTQEQLNALRDYLFRMAKSLEDVAGSAAVAVTATKRADGSTVYSSGDGAGIEEVRQNARELRDLIIKSAKDLGNDIKTGDNFVLQYADNKVEEYNSLYVAQSEFGSFQETIETRIEATARGVVESYDYDSAIISQQESINLLQNYFTSIDGEIRRGIVLDPDSGDYVTGIAISQSMQFSGECGPTDTNNPGDGYVYYYLTAGQTFGLYTSTGWQFWINGHKRGWFDSLDGMLHVANVVVENILQIGTHWQLRTDGEEFELHYV